MTGIEGNFRQTCNNVMRVLRENKDSVMAVLEAFVYDPLLNWRLIDGKNLMNEDCRILILLTQSLRSSPRLERVGGRAVEYKILAVSVFLYYVLPGAYEGKERISHIDTMVISKNKVSLADSHGLMHSRYMYLD